MLYFLLLYFKVENLEEAEQRELGSQLLHADLQAQKQEEENQMERSLRYKDFLQEYDLMNVQNSLKNFHTLCYIRYIILPNRTKYNINFSIE